MKKLLLIGLIVATLAGCVPGGSKKTDAEKMNLRGNVKSVLTLSFEANDKFGEGVITKGQPMFYSFEDGLIRFDSIGNITSKTNWYITSCKPKYVHYFDENGNEVKWYCYKDSGELFFVRTYTNDKDGKAIVATDDDGDKIYYTYDDKGNLVRETRTYSYDLYTYDDRGNQIEERYVSTGYMPSTSIYRSYYDRDDRLIKRSFDGGYWEYRYDDLGQNVISVRYDDDNMVVAKIEEEHDGRGDVVFRRSWDKNGVVESETSFSYMYADSLLLSTVQRDKDMKITTLTTQTYHPNRNIETRIIYGVESRVYDSAEYFYDPAGRLVKIEEDDTSEVYSYDKGRLVEKKRSYDDETLITTYDGRGREKETVVRNEDGEMVEMYRYSYKGNESAGEMERVTLDADLKPGITLRNRYENGLLVEHIYINDGMESRSVYEYDENGNRIKETTDNTDVTTYTYIYDSQGNWISKTFFYNGKPTEIRERVITYE